MDSSQFIGTTETSDPSFNLDIFDRLYKANVIITKRLTSKLIDKLIENKDKCILHLTCTGLGGTKLEPLVPTKEQTFVKFKELIDKGFPVKQVVLRIDPIIATNTGVYNAIKVYELFKGNGIERIRFSFLDMYKHVKERFNENGVRLPYETFHASTKLRMTYYENLLSISSDDSVTWEACGEPGIESIGCISQKDVDILGLTSEIKLDGSAEQRKECKCAGNKKQLIKGKPEPCLNSCLYCFWKTK